MNGHIRNDHLNGFKVIRLTLTLIFAADNNLYLHDSFIMNTFICNCLLRKIFFAHQQIFIRVIRVPAFTPAFRVIKVGTKVGI